MNKNPSGSAVLFCHIASNKYVYRTDLQGHLEDFLNVSVNCCLSVVPEVQIRAAELELPVTSA